MTERGLTTAQLADRFASDAEFRSRWELDQPRIALAANVARLRTELGLTQQMLAAAAGMKQPRIAEIERGDANPRLETLQRVALALRVPIGDLLADERRPAPRAPSPLVRLAARRRPMRQPTG